MRRTARPGRPRAAAILLVPATLALAAAGGASAETLRLGVEGTVAEAHVAHEGLLAEIAAGDRFRWEQVIDLDAALGGDRRPGTGTTAGGPTTVTVGVASLVLRPGAADALRFDFDGIAPAGASFDPILDGSLTRDADGDPGLVLAARDEHPLHEHWSLTATLTLEGLEREDARGPISGVRPTDRLDAATASLVSGSLHAFDHLTGRHHWIATLRPTSVAVAAPAVVVPLPAAAFAGAIGLGLACRLRRRG